jgi:hypothetical protein
LDSDGAAELLLDEVLEQAASAMVAMAMPVTARTVRRMG